MDLSAAIMERNGVSVTQIRAVDHVIAPGVWPDMTEHGIDRDNRNTTFMTWNLLHTARLIVDAGGWPVHGNQRAVWDAGCLFDFENPEHR